MFIGLRPFSIIMDGDTICVYTPNTAIVRVNKRTISCANPGRFFTRIPTDKDTKKIYTPSLCCNIYEDGLPTWFVPESDSECSRECIYDVIGVVVWDEDSEQWVVDQHIVGSHTFDHDLQIVPSGTVDDAVATISEGMTSIILEDGTVQPLPQCDIDLLIEEGYKPGDKIIGEITYEFEEE